MLRLLRVQLLEGQVDLMCVLVCVLCVVLRRLRMMIRLQRRMSQSDASRVRHWPSQRERGRVSCQYSPNLALLPRPPILVSLVDPTAWLPLRLVLRALRSAAAEADARERELFRLKFAGQCAPPALPWRLIGVDRLLVLRLLRRTVRGIR